MKITYFTPEIIAEIKANTLEIVLQIIDEAKTWAYPYIIEEEAKNITRQLIFWGILAVVYLKIRNWICDINDKYNLFR